MAKPVWVVYGCDLAGTPWTVLETTSPTEALIRLALSRGGKDPKSVTFGVYEKDAPERGDREAYLEEQLREAFGPREAKFPHTEALPAGWREVTEEEYRDEQRDATACAVSSTGLTLPNGEEVLLEYLRDGTGSGIGWEREGEGDENPLHFYRLGCEHAYRELSPEERERDTPHLAHVGRVSRCDKCGKWRFRE